MKKSIKVFLPKVLVVLLLFLQSNHLGAQTEKAIIKGIIKDSISNELLIAATVEAVKSKTVVTTDVNGKFSISAFTNDTLVIRYLGYNPTKVPINNMRNITINLSKATFNIDEVVVVAYGAVKRKDLTGSVSEVKITDLQKAPVADFEQALAGRIAGVQVSSSDGTPGGEMDIVIRGGNSLTQSNSPLYVIDGFPQEESAGPMLSPSDIQSISILKDASATAIYGSRGANGVVIIETKKGKIGKPVVTYEGSFGINTITKKMTLMDPYEFVKYQIELNPTGESNAIYTYLTLPGRELDDYKNIKGIDWQNKMFGRGKIQNHNIMITGGSVDSKYIVSGSFFDNTGVVVNTGYKKYQGRMNLSQRINTKLSTDFSISAGSETSYGRPPTSSNSTSLQPYSTFLMYSVWGYRPVSTDEIDLIDELIDPAVQDTRVNPYLSAINEVFLRSTQTIRANANIDYAILKNLKLNVRAVLNGNLREVSAFYNEKTAYGYPYPTNDLGVNGSIHNYKSVSFLNENLLRYWGQINKNNKYDVLGGITLQRSNNRSSGYKAKNIINQELGLSGIDGGDMASMASQISENTLASFLGRVNFNHKSKYLLTATIRADGSSKFSYKNRWRYLPSAGFAWNMHSEPFFKRLSFVSNSKLRTSYGLTGNNRISDFAYMSPMSTPYSNYYSFNNQTPQQGAVPSQYGNEDLKWEKTAQFDIGYDLSLFKDRIGVTLDLYRKITSDLLLNANVPYTSGYSNILTNVGKIQNQGLELTINLVNVKTKDFIWTTDFNIAFNSNKVLALADGQQQIISTVGFPASYSKSELYITEIGAPAASFYGYKWLGNYQVEDFDLQENGKYLLKEDVASNGTPRNQIQPGDIKYADLNNDLIVNSEDRMIIGNCLPKHIGGFANDFKYKGFSLSVFFQWSYGNDIYNQNRYMFEGNPYGRINLNQFASYANRWTFDNPNNEYYRVRGQGPIGMFSSRTVEDGSFLRLKNLAFSYDFSNALLSKVGIKSLNLYALAQNVFTWTNYSGMDPEVSTEKSILTPGYDYSAYPRERTIVFGLKASF